MTNFTNRYSGYTARLDAGGSDVILDQLTSVAITPGASFSQANASGETRPVGMFLNFADPRINIVTADIGAVAGISGFEQVGLHCTGASLFQFQQRSIAARFIDAATTAHVNVTAAKGFLMPESISVSQDSEAVLNMTFIPLWDPSVTNYEEQPLLANNGVALNATDAPDFGSLYYLGPMVETVANPDDAIEGLTSLTINFGIGFRTVRSDGDIFARTGYIYRQDPSVTMTFADPNAPLGNINDLFGHVMGTSRFKFFLIPATPNTTARRDEAGGLSFLVDAGMASKDNVTVSEETDASVSITLTPYLAGLTNFFTMQAEDVSAEVDLLEDPAG